jgi:hypothetical protein
MRDAGVSGPSEVIHLREHRGTAYIQIGVTLFALRGNTAVPVVEGLTLVSPYDYFADSACG